MTKLFNKGGDGAGEIVRVLGLIDNDLDFTKWEPILPLGIRDLQAIIGTEPIDAVDKYYREDHADGTESDGMAETLRLMQQAVAMFTWLKVIPTLDAQHGTAGRGKHLGENETGMSASQPPSCGCVTGSSPCCISSGNCKSACSTASRYASMTILPFILPSAHPAGFPAPPSPWASASVRRPAPR